MMGKRTALARLVCVVIVFSSTACGGDDGQLNRIGQDQETSPGDNGPERETIPAADGPLPANRLSPEHFTYLGAFRLPDEFSWGALGMSYYPDGDDGAGSLFVTGFQGLLDGSSEPCYEGSTGCSGYFAEVTIPSPAVNADWQSLPMAEFLQGMTVFDGGLVQTVHEAYSFVSDIAYLQTADGERLVGSLDEWYPEGSFGDDTFPTIWTNNLDGSDPQGMFYVGPDQPPFHGIKMGSYLFTVPQHYADQYLDGRTLVTGRARGTAPPDSEGLNGEGSIAGGSQGPTLFAFSPPEPGQSSGELDALPMLYYRVRYPGCAGPDIGVGEAAVDCDFSGFSMCDDWTGAAFLQSGDRAAIAIAGLVGTTNCYYCGDPVDDSECEADVRADGCPYTCDEGRGYHCGPYFRQVLLYDTEELGRAAQGEVDPWSILPYAVWEPEEFFIQGAACSNLGGMAYDLENGRLFLIERGLGGADWNAAVVHVWAVRGE
jgi:hypothetical protein